MKKIIILLLISLNALSQSNYKYCELVGYQKGIFNFKIIVGVDSGSTAPFRMDAIMDTLTVEKIIEYKNEKFYVTTDEPMYEGKTVNADSKGKFIWKKIEVGGGGIEKKLKPKTFNSMVDGMNYMGRLGWEFAQAYTVTSGNQNIYHWLLKRKTN